MGQAPVIVNVDDNEPSRYTRSRILRAANFTVYDAGTGTDAIALLEHCPDLVLLDVNLPDMSGIDVCRHIKTHPNFASVIVLHISASAVQAPQASEALNSGADSYLVEPVDADVLIATIRALLRLRHAERELARYNAALRDANENLNLLNLALQRSNEDLEHFAYLASHDLQEPLRTITTHLQLISKRLGTKLAPAEAQLFGFVVDGARRMGLLIDDVMAYSRVGREVPDSGMVALNDAVSWAIKDLTDGIQAAGATVVVDDLPSVWGDTLQLSQVFQNLIANSLKYRSAEPPRIEIEAKVTEAQEVVVTVRDNGIGISAEHADHIFRPFKRLHGREIPGTGIGLALVRRIIEGHGGRIWLSPATGNGAEFLFSLKMAEPPAE